MILVKMKMKHEYGSVFIMYSQVTEWSSSISSYSYINRIYFRHLYMGNAYILYTLVNNHMRL